MIEKLFQFTLARIRQVQVSLAGFDGADKKKDVLEFISLEIDAFFPLYLLPVKWIVKPILMAAIGAAVDVLVDGIKNGWKSEAVEDEQEKPIPSFTDHKLEQPFGLEEKHDA